MFGQHLVHGLARSGLCHVIVCGRSAAKAQAAIDAMPSWSSRVSPAVLDRGRATAADIAALQVVCVVDAAGPFQGQSYRFAEAVIAAGAHYVDLADARDFVAGFATLDAAAKARGVLAVTGASSTPALSNAVLDDITRGWTRVDGVEIAISPGGRVAYGLSVIAAILSYVGRPVRVLRHGHWDDVPGWGMLGRRRFADLGRRWLSLVETPDLDLVPKRFAAARNAVFRAGLELSLLHLGLWLLGFLVRFGWLRSLEPLAEPLRDASALVRGLASDAGGMIVEATGIYADGARLKTTWTLIAEGGDGPVIPTLPALIVVKRLLSGELRVRGAMPCVGLVELGALESEFKRLQIRSERETQMLERASLFRRVLRDFDAMPASVCAAHDIDAGVDLQGEVDIDGADGWPGRLIARLFGFPQVGRSVPARVTIEREGDGEIWVRRFGTAGFASHLSAGGAPGLLVERFGAVSLDLEASAQSTGFSLAVRRARLGKVPLPPFLTPQTQALATVDAQGRYTFDVTIALPLFGRLVRYRGWLA